MVLKYHRPHQMCDDSDCESDSTEQERTYELRTVHLPLEKLDKCAVCQGTEFLRLCSSCGERLYCSAECQKKDWPSHKPECGKTDRIELGIFYPLLGCMAEAAHQFPDNPMHPAMTHKILNSPNPGAGVVSFPDGSTAKLVLLGDEIPLTQIGSRTWWPTALSDNVRAKLLRRIMREGHVLPIVLSLCIALLAEMYTTTYVPASEAPNGKMRRRVRLQYRKSPITDFGIVKGEADVKGQDRLAYFNVLDNTFQKGQDPEEHYWMYFTTVRGEEFILDCSMFTFNFCLTVVADPYCKYGLPPLGIVPAFFRDRVFNRNTPRVEKEHQRFSVLRNKTLQDAVRHSVGGFRSPDTIKITGFLNHVAGRIIKPHGEQHLAMHYCVNNSTILQLNLEQHAWEQWPAEPQLVVEKDPGEMDDMPPEEDEAWWKYMKKWNRKQRRGEITSEQLGEAFRAWTNRHGSRGNSA